MGPAPGRGRLLHCLSRHLARCADDPPRTTSETSAFPLPIRASREKFGSSPTPASALTPPDRSHAQAKRCARASSIPAVCPAPSPRWPLSKVRSRPRPRRRHPTFSTRRTNPSNLPRTSQLSRENRTIQKTIPLSAARVRSTDNSTLADRPHPFSIPSQASPRSPWASTDTPAPSVPPTLTPPGLPPPLTSASASPW